MNLDIIGIIGAAGAILGGMWALFRFVIKTFLDHLKTKDQYIEKMAAEFSNVAKNKNGHTERIAQEFSDTVKGFQQSINENNIQLSKIADNHQNVTSVLDRATRAINDHHKHK